MANIVSGKYEQKIDGTISTSVEFKKRGIVILNRKNNKIWSIEAKARNTDMYSVVKYLAKAYLADERRTYLGNDNEATRVSKNREINFVSAALSGDVIMITDKDGNIRKDSVVFAEDTLRKSYGVRKSHTIYKLVVEEGLEWSDERVVYHLDMWVKATMQHLSARSRSDEAIETAANHTESIEKAAEKATAEKATAEKVDVRKAAARKAAQTRARNRIVA